MRYLVLILLMGCASHSYKRVVHSETFNPYIKKFQDDYRRVTGKTIEVTTPIMFWWVKHSMGVNAYCELNQRYIIVDKPMWDGMDETEREMVIYHELGHCTSLNRMHDDTRLPSGIKKSLMHTYMFHKDIYRANREHYLKELFNE